MTGCSSIDETKSPKYGEEVEVTILLSKEGYISKTIDPDEDILNDLNLMIFDRYGNLEESLWITDFSTPSRITLIQGEVYHFRACANFGYRIKADSLEEADAMTYHLAYPDEYQNGIAMSAREDDIMINDGTPVLLHLKRLMSKISIRIDRSGLSENILMNVRSVRIGNCPKHVSIFKESHITDHDQCFTVGFSREDYETDILNSKDKNGMSHALPLYMLENMQGDFGKSLTEDSQKVFEDNDPRKDICSFIEMEFEYMSDTHYSKTKNLVYRFYLGESLNNLDIERNCHYRIVVRPEDDGLSENSWRVDKSGIVSYGQSYFNAYPREYIRGDIGEQIHLWCEFSPPYAPFDIGIDYLEEDKAAGIYDYTIDEDGHGVLLTLTGPGRGMIYMEAGEPVNDAALFIIEVNQP